MTQPPYYGNRDKLYRYIMLTHRRMAEWKYKVILFQRSNHSYCVLDANSARLMFPDNVSGGAELDIAIAFIMERRYRICLIITNDGEVYA
jgi:hypothetical protein